MENFIISLNCVTPIFLYMLAGYYAYRKQFVADEVYPAISRLAFNVMLPFTLFNSIYSADLGSAFSIKLLGFLLGITILLFTVGTVAMFRLVPDRRKRGLYIQNLYRGNLAIIGISIAQNLMDADGVASMGIVVTCLVALYNALAVIALELCRGNQIDGKKLLISIAKNPLIIGCLCGILFVAFGLKLPHALETAVSGLGSTGSIVTMVALGATFRFAELRRNAVLLTKLTITRLVIMPAIVVSAALLLGFRGNELAIITLCGACPIATSVYPMALVYDSDADLTGQLVITTSLFCCFTLFLWVFAGKQLGLF